MTGFPWRPGTIGDVFATAPIYVGGVIAVGAANGKVYIVDQDSGGAIPAVIRTYSFGAPVSSISINRQSNRGNGACLIATSTGKLYYMPLETDPTPGSI